MGGYSIITKNIHSDRSFRKLEPMLKLLYFTLLTYPFGNKTGMFEIDPEYLASLMRTDEETLKGWLKSSTDLWMYDESTCVVLIPNYLKYNKIGGAKTFTSMKYELEQLPKTRLCVDFIYKLNELTDGAGLEYVPQKMLRTAQALTKSADTTKKVLVNQLINKYIS